MRCRNGLGFIICITPSIVDRPTSSPWLPEWNFVFCYHNYDYIVKQNVSFACSCINSSIVWVVRVSTGQCSTSESMFVSSERLVALPIKSTKYMTRPNFFGVSIARSQRSSSSGVLYALPGCSWEKASVGRCFLPA